MYPRSHGRLGPVGPTARWRILLCEFDFSLEYKKGKKNTIADAISSLPTTGETEVDPDQDVPLLTLAPARLLSATADDVAEDLLDDVDERGEFTDSICRFQPPLLNSISHEEIIR